MASTIGHQTYDENLLASAPVATKAQLQGGYNPDLLVEKTTPPPPPTRTPAPARDGRGLESQSTPPKQPFYRTKKGIIIIFVAVVVIIAVIVGGAVGGSKKKKNNNLTTGTVTGSGQSSTQGNGQSGAFMSGSSSASSTSSSAANSQVVGPPGSTPSATGPPQMTVSNVFSLTIPSFPNPITQPTTTSTPSVNGVGAFNDFS